MKNTEAEHRNAATIESEIAWFREVLDLRFKVHAGEKSRCDPLAELAPPVLSGKK